MRLRVIIVGIIMLSSVLFGGSISPRKGPKPTYLSIGGKRYKYWLCETGKTIHFDLKGPGETRVFIRTEAGKNPEVKVFLDDEKIKTITIKEEKSKKSDVKKIDNITKAETFKVKIPYGKHTLSFTPDTDVIIRVSLTKSEKYYSFAPQRHSGGMVLIARETEYGYYKSIKEHPVECEIIGDGTIKIYSRLLYSKDMKGTHHYSVAISIDGAEPTVYEFETEPSSVSYFRTDGDIIPSKAGKINVKIPSGKHTITISPVNSNPIAVRVLIPQSMLKRK